jgi:pyrimidine operon attenuation protein / uracil phosphoribosyltransferase
MAAERLKTELLGAAEIDRALTRMAHEILERNPGGDLVLVGIKTRGEMLAGRLAAKIARIEGKPEARAVGGLDVTFYRDDSAMRNKAAAESLLPFDVEGRSVVLVDDVLYTGRTIRAALNVLFDYGRPARVRLATLVDRGGRELPIAAEFVGGTLEVPADDIVVVERTPAGRLTLSITRSDGAA